MRLVRRLPKRGFKSLDQSTYVPVNVADLERFDNGAVVTPDSLQKSGLAKNAADGIKILGTGSLSKKLAVKAQAFSASAKAKIEAAGGSCEVLTTKAT